MVDVLAPEGDEGRGQTAISHGELSNELRSVDFRMGQPAGGHAPASAEEFILRRSRPGGVKHLSTPRKREQQ